MIAISTVLLGAILTFGLLWGGSGLAVLAWRGSERRWWGPAAVALSVGVAIWTTWLIVARANGWLHG